MDTNRDTDRCQPDTIVADAPQTTSTCRCVECGEHAVKLVRRSSFARGGFRIVDAQCRACGVDVKGEIAKVERDAREGA